MGYLNLVGTFVYKDPVFRAKLDALAENDASLKDDGWNDSSITVFFQAAVPTGWTKITTQNDKFLRVVNTSGGGSGGTKAPSSTIALTHTHTISADAGHTHTMAAHSHLMASGDRVVIENTNDYIIGTGNADLVVWNNLQTPKSDQNPNTDTTQTTVNSDAGTTSAGSHGHTLTDALTDTTFQYCDVIIGSKDTSSGYTNLTTQFNSGDKIDFDYFDSLADNDAYNYARLMPASSIMIFGQAAAPIGWTKLATLNDRALRVVSGTGGGTGGSTLLSSGLSLIHTHSMDTQGSHTHTSGVHAHDIQTSGVLSLGQYDPVGKYIATNGAGIAMTITDGTAVSRTIARGRTATDGSGITSSTGSSAHIHSLISSLTSAVLAYVDVIQCSKDSGGAPYSYTDYTTEFAWKKLVTYQRMNTMAKSDAYIEFHTTPSGSQAFFFMASPPIKWTKITTHNDKALRIVSGSTGGSGGGGAQTLSAQWTLAHTHTILAYAHTHSITHSHASDTRTEANAGANVVVAGFTKYAASVNGFLQVGSISIGRVSVAQGFNNTVASTSVSSHEHGTISSSSLTNFTFAYADVIYCSKD